ncbi:hypothetical protein D3C87_1270510 [compost metagenome]
MVKLPAFSEAIGVAFDISNELRNSERSFWYSLALVIKTTLTICPPPVAVSKFAIPIFPLSVKFAPPEIISHPFSFVGADIVGSLFNCTVPLTNLAHSLLKFSLAEAVAAIALVITAIA